MILQLLLFVCVCVAGVVGGGVRLRVGCSYPPIRNDIVTPRHLLNCKIWLKFKFVPFEKIGAIEFFHLLLSIQGTIFDAIIANGIFVR